MAKVKVKRTLPNSLRDNTWEPGRSGNKNPKGGKKPPTLFAMIQKMLNSRSPTGTGTRRDDSANSYVKQMEMGSFIHHKEIIDREEGKVPTRLADAEGGKLKLYGSLPLEGEESP